VQRDAVSRISSAVECFAAIAGECRHHLNPTGGLRTVHMEGKRVILMCAKDRDRADERLNKLIPLEWYFGRSIGSADEQLTYAQYFSLFQSAKRKQGEIDQCFHSNHIIPKFKPAFYILKDASLSGRERFCLRLLLRKERISPARSRRAIRNRNRIAK
jgi:hypothetical protein